MEDYIYYATRSIRIANTKINAPTSTLHIAIYVCDAEAAFSIQKSD